MAKAKYIVNQFFPKVKEVVDANTPLTVEITKQDNRVSKIKDHNGCAMAVACKRKFQLDGVIISVKTAYLIKGTKATRYILPESVSREVVSFDRKAGFDTGTYQLSPITNEGHRLGAKHSPKLTDDRTNNGSPKHRFRHFTSGIRAALGSKKAPDGITVKQSGEE